MRNPAAPANGDNSPKLAGAKSCVAYFGYGSLVNIATHRTDIVQAMPARLNGWRRCWRPRPVMRGFPAALLTVRREPGAICDGLLVIDHAVNLAAIDAREARYRRLPVAPDEIELASGLPRDCPVFVYEAEPGAVPHPQPAAILQSYLDAVLQGFLAVYGEAGVRRFVAETDGFDTPLHPDRDAPLYPHSVRLAPAERQLFDAVLAERRAKSP